ncbi:MAG: hypothetical protein PVH61_41715 [Candidatus Aminicenantes bacterium]|jgi:hypothetical protein
MKEETLLPIIIIGIVIIILVVVTLVILKVIKRRRHQQAEFAGGPEMVAKGASGEGTYEGTTYRYKHFKGTDKAPPYFSIMIPCTSSGAFSITPETKFDRFFKKLGVCVEIDTHDAGFDDAFYINTNTIPFTRSFLEKSENRRSIQALFQLGFNYLKHDGQNLTITWRNFPRRTQMEVETMEKAVALLAEQGGSLAKITTYEMQEPTTWKQKRLFAFAFPILLAITGITALIIGLSQYRPLDSGKVFVDSFKFSVPLLVLFVWFSIRLLRGRSSSHRELIAVFFISLFAFPLAGFGYRGFLNGALDDSPAAVHQVIVLNKYYSRSKNNYTYYAVVNSWRKPESEEKLRISKSFYNYLQPGSSTITVKTKPGKFGFEWIVEIK